MSEHEIISVTRLNREVRTLIERSLSSVWVEGEISGFKKAASGHLYFTLKDEAAAVSCVMWKSTAALLKFAPAEGMKVIVKAKATLYDVTGSYQLSIEAMRPCGEGDILAELERRKQAYIKEGLFDSQKKRPIPKKPGTVAVVTSETGAVIHDIITTIRRRDRSINVILLPTAVQGIGAGEQIARRIMQANEFMIADVLIVGRGGGSVEDLLPFSDDCVVRAVAASDIPVISAVGHETDWALCDFAADMRAPTPTGAAELVSSVSTEYKEVVDKMKSSCIRLMQTRIRETHYRVEGASDLKHSLFFRLKLAKNDLSRLSREIKNSATKTLSSPKLSLKAETAKLKVLSPSSVLERGYAIASINGKTAKAEDLKEGVEFNIRFAGSIVAAVSKGASDGR